MSRAVDEDKVAMFSYCLFVVGLAAVVQAGLPEAGGFRYSVNDFNGNEQSHQQNRGPGNAVNGQYKVLLPDGRLQTVTYIADEGGYRAKVDYTPAAPGEATTAGKGLPLPATSRFSSVIGNGYGGGGGFGPSAFGAAPYGAGAIAAGAFGATGGYYGGGFNQFAGGYNGGSGAAYNGGNFGGANSYVTGGGSYGGGFSGGFGNNYQGTGISGGHGYSSPIYGALGYNPIGYSSASPTGYSYGYSTPFSQVYSYSNMLGGIGYY